MKLFPTRRQVARAQARLVYRFFIVMGAITVTYLVIVAASKLLR